MGGPLLLDVVTVLSFSGIRQECTCGEDEEELRVFALLLPSVE
jgi:hypothetical protein